MIYDVAVIGLGPAGSMFCSCISEKLSVIAIDKKSTDEKSFQKPCGGLLAPDAQKILSLMQLNLPKDTLVDPQIFSVRTICLDSAVTRHYQRMYVNVDRHKFDLWMQQSIKPHVKLSTESTVTSISYDGYLYTVSYIKNGTTHCIKSKMLVGADGAKSTVRHFIYPKLKLRSYIAIQQWFEDHNPQPFYSCIFDSSVTDCCSWSISKDGKFIFGGAYPISESRKRFEAQKEKLKDYGFVFGDPIKTEACLVLRPKSPCDIVSGNQTAFLIGEAAGLVSPSSLEGISYAMQSAYLLASALNKNVKKVQKEYSTSLIHLRMKILAKLIKCPFMYNKHIRSIIMHSGIESVKLYEK